MPTVTGFPSITEMLRANQLVHLDLKLDDTTKHNKAGMNSMLGFSLSVQEVQGPAFLTLIVAILANRTVESVVLGKSFAKSLSTECLTCLLAAVGRLPHLTKFTVEDGVEVPVPIIIQFTDLAKHLIHVDLKKVRLTPDDDLQSLVVNLKALPKIREMKVLFYFDESGGTKSTSTTATAATSGKSDTKSSKSSAMDSSSSDRKNPAPAVSSTTAENDKENTHHIGALSSSGDGGGIINGKSKTGSSSSSSSGLTQRRKALEK